MPYLALFLFILALFLFWLSRRQRRRTGLPGGRIIYSDTRTWGAVERPLYDQELALTGKPDYLIEHQGVIIPVEVKSGRAPDTPYDAHIFQLAVYCLLVEKIYGKRPPYGIIHYPGRDFAIDYTPALEADLQVLIADMRSDDRQPEVHRSHEEALRCKHCGYRGDCNERLG